MRTQPPQNGAAEGSAVQIVGVDGRSKITLSRDLSVYPPKETRDMRLLKHLTARESWKRRQQKRSPENKEQT